MKPSTFVLRCLRSASNPKHTPLLTCGCALLAMTAQAQKQDSLAGEAAAQKLKESISAEEYNIQYGPVRFKTEADLELSYVDNVFYSHGNRQDDFVINPEIRLSALWPVTDLNTLRLSTGIGYEYYVENTTLNSDAPLVNPDSELIFNIFAGGFRITLRDRFSYQETLFYNNLYGENGQFFNFTDIGRFSRLDNLAGVTVQYDLQNTVFTVSYDHETFHAFTDSYEYLNRGSELLGASAGYLLGDGFTAGGEVQAALHNFRQDTVLDDNWRLRTGPFVEMSTEAKLRLRAGTGYEMARYDESESSDFDTYYVYAKASQETRLFTHSLAAGREHLLGNNANNLRSTYARYSITSPIMRQMELGGSASVNWGKEFGGPYFEEFLYYQFRLQLEYELARHWRTGVGYALTLKESEQALRDFHRNRVNLSLTYTF